MIYANFFVTKYYTIGIPDSAVRTVLYNNKSYPNITVLLIFLSSMLFDRN
jgi:hypothetical protein